MWHSFENLGRCGQLGNQLWEIAGTIGLAERDGDRRRASFPPWAYASEFSVPAAYFAPAPEPAIDPGFDYLQDMSLFAGCTEFIHEIFRPSAIASARCAAAYAPVLSPAHTTSVHVRRGDYLAQPDWHPLCSEHYYRTAMALARRRHRNTTFVVFSDDIEWCRRSFPSERCVFVSPVITAATGNPTEIDELNLMRSCDAHIIANSTYSWWAAYLSRSAEVYHPDIWFGPELDTMDARLFLPPAWTPVPNEQRPRRQLLRRLRRTRQTDVKLEACADELAPR